MKKLLIILIIAGGALVVIGQRNVVAGEQDTRTTVLQDTLENVQGSCGMCKVRIEKTAKGVLGVTSASWDQKNKRLALVFDPAKTSQGGIARALARIGHDTGKEKADDTVYSALPGCCKYRK